MLDKDAMNILLTFLDKKTREAEQEISETGNLSDNKAIPLILKAQFNHIAHLERMVDERFEHVDERFEQVNRRFEQVDRHFEQVDRHFEQVDRRFEEMKTDMDKRFERVGRNLFRGVAFLSFLMTFYGFLITLYHFTS